MFADHEAVRQEVAVVNTGHDREAIRARLVALTRVQNVHDHPEKIVMPIHAVFQSPQECVIPAANRSPSTVPSHDQLAIAAPVVIRVLIRVTVMIKMRARDSYKYA